jgi:hypothetical protein
MGLAIFVIYLPAFAIISLIAIFISTKFIRTDRDAISTASKVIAYVAGGLIALVATTLYAWWYSVHSTNEWAPIIGSLAISLIGPSCVGLLMMIIGVIWTSKPSSFIYAVSGVWASTFAMPFFGALILWLYLGFYDDIVHKPTFDKLCKNSGLVFFEHVPPAKSVAFIPNNFDTTPRNGAAYQDPTNLIYFPTTTLEYIEGKVHGWDGKDRLVRWITAEVQAKKPFTQSNFEKSEIPIDILTAEYQVTPSALEIPASLAKRTYGRKIEVTRRSDGKLIAQAQYYWDIQKWWQCPDDINRGNFVTDFIAKSLNIPVR